MPLRPLTALLLGAALTACSEPMERPAPPPEAGSSETETKTAEVPVPEIRDAEGISPQDASEEEEAAAPLFDPREADAAARSFDPAGAKRPDALGEAEVVSRAKGSFTAPGANETAWLVRDESGPRIILVSIGGMTQEVALGGAANAARIVAAEDTDLDGLTELLLYTGASSEEDTSTATARHLSLRSGEMEMVESWDAILTDPCGAETQPGERTGIVLRHNEDTGGIEEEPFSEPC